MDKLAYRVETRKSFDDVVASLEKAAPAAGFRILALHDTKATLAEKGFSINPLKIFEVCNAKFAYEALGKDIDVSLFMPCRIVVREESDRTVIVLARPSLIAEMIPGKGLEALAGKVEKQLIEIIDAVK